MEFCGCRYFAGLRSAMPNSLSALSGTAAGASDIRSVPRAVLGNGITSRIDVLIVDRGEGMVRRHPAIILVVPLEHRKIHHPQELKILRVQQLVAVVELVGAE